jgi:hypothetical protein
VYNGVVAAGLSEACSRRQANDKKYKFFHTTKVEIKMKEYSEIKKLIKAIATGRLAVGTPSPVFLVQVKSVDGDACTVEIDGMELSGVRLRSVINGNKSKVVITPAVGSYVLVTDISGNLTQLVALQYAEVDRIDITYSGKLVINEGTDTAVRASAIESKLNALRGTVNDLISKFNSHTHPATTTATTGVSTPATVAVTAPTGAASPADAFKKSDFECKTVNL